MLKTTAWANRRKGFHMLYRLRLVGFAMAFAVATGCGGGGSGGLVNGPNGNGQPPNDTQQPVTGGVTSLCEQACPQLATCLASSSNCRSSTLGQGGGSDQCTPDQSAGTGCVSNCEQLLTGLPSCETESTALVACVAGKSISSCNDLFAACTSQLLGALECIEKTSQIQLTQNPCDSLSDPCQKCTCQHGGSVSACTSVCSQAGAG